MPLRCPRDEKPLTIHAIEDSDVRRCWTCHGLWVGYVALERLADVSVRQYLQAGARRDAPSDAPRCPADGGPLVPITVAGVEIDVCPSCKGTWLDRMELARIRERRRGPPPDSKDDDTREEALDALGDLDLRRFWRWVKEHLPDDWGDADVDF